MSKPIIANPDLKAKSGCCEEASPRSVNFYIPCNAPADKVVFVPDDNSEYRMCAACADHNIKNRGAEDRGPYNGPAPELPTIAAPAMGHNIGNVPSPEVIAEYLAESYKGDVARANDLLEAFDRVPEKIEDEETNKRAADFAKKLASHVRVLENDHKGEKQPYLDGGRAVDGFFKGLADKLKVAKGNVEKRQTVFANAKAAEERKRRDEEARIARERAEKEAQAALDRAAALPADAADAALDDAIALEDQANVAAEATQASNAELSRTRTDLGVVSSLNTFWDFEIENKDALDLDKLRPYLPMDAIEKATRAYVKAGGRDLNGARIFQNTKVVNR